MNWHIIYQMTLMLFVWIKVYMALKEQDCTSENKVLTLQRIKQVYNNNNNHVKLNKYTPKFISKDNLDL